MFVTKRNPSKIKRELDLAELTVSEAFAQYRSHLPGRTKPAKPNTLVVLDKAENRLKEWQNLRVKDLTGSEILRKFSEIATRARTAAEQTSAGLMLRLSMRLKLRLAMLRHNNGNHRYHTIHSQS